MFYYDRRVCTKAAEISLIGKQPWKISSSERRNVEDLSYLISNASFSLWYDLLQHNTFNLHLLLPAICFAVQQIITKQQTNRFVNNFFCLTKIVMEFG